MLNYFGNYLSETEAQLEEYLGVRNPFYDYLLAMKTQMPGGANIVGMIAARVKALWESIDLGFMGDRLTYAPGDRTLNFGDKNNPVRVGLGAPIDYDIWYVFGAGNVLKFGGKSVEESMEKMAGFFEEVDQAKPLIPPVENVDPNVFIYPRSGGTVGTTLFASMTSGRINLGTRSHQYAIKEARFETWLTGNSAEYYSNGPKAPDGDGYAGYIAFPVGPLGVMWRISLATESSLASGLSTRVVPIGAQNETIEGGEILPPFDLNKKETCGEMMMNKGYIIDDDSVVEKFAEGAGTDQPPYHYWLRYWIKKDNTEIVPGEFCGLLCRPWPLHCWWNQETAPIVYSGHWVETEFYTSGIVKEVIEPEDGEVGNRYKIWAKNEEIIVKSSDFLEYEVDERVGLLKTWREGSGDSGGYIGPVSDIGEPANFNWKNLSLLDTGEALTEDWVIVPAGFYESSGSSVGG